MGCDIHGPWVYGQRLRTRLDGTTWKHWTRLAELDWHRDYCLFSYLADVRNDGDHEAVSQPKGPHPDWALEKWAFWNVSEDDSSNEIWCDHEHEHQKNGDCHSQSWLSTDEVVEVQLRYTAHQHGSYPQRPSDELAMAIALMRTAESLGYEDVHIGFCFDN